MENVAKQGLFGFNLPTLSELSDMGREILDFITPDAQSNSSQGRNAPRHRTEFASPLITDVPDHMAPSLAPIDTQPRITETPDGVRLLPSLSHVYAACAERLADVPTASTMIPECVVQYTSALTEAARLIGSTALDTAVHACFQEQPDGPRYLAKQFGECVDGVHKAAIQMTTPNLSNSPAFGSP